MATPSDPAAERTERFIMAAGIGPSMRVLDIGCGRGDVSFLLARLVGDRGAVVGIDRDPRMLTAATERAAALDQATIQFVEGDFHDLETKHGLFDAAVARRVLMYQEDPAEAIKRLCRSISPGGRVVFEEVDSTISLTSRSKLPLHEKVQGWIWETLEREGSNVHMGFDLHQVLLEGGLTQIEIRAEAIVNTPSAASPFAPILRGILPRMIELGVASEEDVDLDTLDGISRGDQSSLPAAHPYIGRSRRSPRHSPA